jgi:hypothetical protein
MSLRARLNRLEKTLGRDRGPEMIVISTASDRHEIRWVNPWILGLVVPWDPKYLGHADPIEDLTAEQHRMIGPNVKVLEIALSPDEQGADRDITGL